MHFFTFMYRRPTLCTLHIAVDFLKSLKIAVVLGGGCYKYWDVMYTLHPSTSLQMPNIELHRPGIEPRPPPPTIELWNLYIMWVC